MAQLHDLAGACDGRHSELVLVLGLAGLRWGELAGLHAGERSDLEHFLVPVAVVLAVLLASYALPEVTASRTIS